MARKPISAQLRYLILERDRFTCQSCGASAPNATLHVDHVTAVANGGGNDPSNLRAICITCNIGKGSLETNVTSIAPVQNYPIRTSDNEVKCRGQALGEPIFWIGSQWAVTADGVEARDGFYVIEKERLWEGEGSFTWEQHMAEKEWVDRWDFRQAMTWARNHFASLRKARRA